MRPRQPSRGRSRLEGAVPREPRAPRVPAGPHGEGATAAEPYLTPRVLRLRHLVWAILLAWLVLAVIVIALVTLL